VLALFGSRVPSGLKVLLLSVAIVDDIGAIIVIAIFYTGGLAWSPLAIAVGLLVVIAVLYRSGGGVVAGPCPARAGGVAGHLRLGG
jgi:NhaA family Na+:H+ antiporter